MFDLSRRSFCKTVIASAAVSAFKPVNLFAADGAAPNLRFGVVSDVHITSLASTDYWEKTRRISPPHGIKSSRTTRPPTDAMSKRSSSAATTTMKASITSITTKKDATRPSRSRS